MGKTNNYSKTVSAVAFSQSNLFSMRPKTFCFVFRELLDMATENYLRLVRQHVTDYGVLWSTALKKLCAFPGENLICFLSTKGQKS